jgi:hypothetical protein
VRGIVFDAFRRPQSDVLQLELTPDVGRPFSADSASVRSNYFGAFLAPLVVLT